MSKEQEYIALCKDRKKCDRCESHLRNASKIERGHFDCDRIGAYSRWQGNLDAELMVVGRDFADEERFSRLKGLPDPRAKTNRNLVELVGLAGITIEPPSANGADDRLFFTNAVLCMSPKGKTITHACYKQCANAFLRPLIEIVKPMLVVSMGANAMRAVWSAFHADEPCALDCPALDPIVLNETTEFMALGHPSPPGQISRPLFDQREDWRVVGDVLSAMRRTRARM